MTELLIAKVSIVLNAPIDNVWNALTNPALIKQYMFGTNVTSTWVVGSPIVWKGEWQGKSYEDKGTILKADRGKTLQYTHFSPLSGKADIPENYNTVTITLTSQGGATVLELSQDNNHTDEARVHSEQNWKLALGGLKKLLENSQ